MRVLHTLLAATMLVGASLMPLAASAATVSTVNIKEGTVTYRMAQISDTNPAINDAVNQATMDMVHKILDAQRANPEGFQAGALDYKVTEDSGKRFSIYISAYYDDGGPYGHHLARGLVFDPKTGKQIPLVASMPLTVDKINKALNNGVLTMVSDDNRPLRFLNMWPAQQLTADYYTRSNGSITLLFPELALGPEPYGVVTVTITKKQLKSLES